MKHLNKEETRRQFIRQPGGASLLLSTGTFPGSVEAGDRRREMLFGMTRHSGPNDVLQVACIGMGIMGYNDTDAAIKVPGVSLVAVCDLYSGGAWEYTLLW